MADPRIPREGTEACKEFLLDELANELGLATRPLLSVRVRWFDLVAAGLCSNCVRVCCCPWLDLSVLYPICGWFFICYCL